MAARHRGYSVAIVLVCIGTAVLLPLRDVADFAHLAWLYLCLVGFVAWLVGTGPALLAAVMSFLGGNFFLTPPYGTFTVADPLDVLQLVVFLIGAATVGALTGRLREREITAQSNEEEATALARLSAEMAQGFDVEDVVNSAVRSLTRLGNVESVAVWLPTDDRGLIAHGPGARFVAGRDHELAETAFTEVKALGLPPTTRAADRLGTGWPARGTERGDDCCGVIIPLVSASSVEGVLQLLPGSAGLGEREASLAVSVSHLLALFLAGRRALAVAARMQASEEAEHVKSAIVSAVSHELKTPLASAMAAVTDLASEDVSRAPGEVRGRLAAVEGDLRRLEAAIGDLLDLSRLQAESWLPHPDLYEAGEILGDVSAAATPRVRGRLSFRVPQGETTTVHADFAQISRALRAILENAVAYSEPDSEILAGADRIDDLTRIWIEDRGPGVSDADKPFIFDRAYRGDAGKRMPGTTGLGLTIARDLVAANRGRLFVEDADPVGARFVVELPAAPPTTGAEE